MDFRYWTGSECPRQGQHGDIGMHKSGTVNRFAQTRQASGHSHGGVSPDGCKIIFESDRHDQTATDGNGNHIFEAFVAEVPQS